jgi:predicted transcriptional regulator
MGKSLGKALESALKDKNESDVKQGRPSLLIFTNACRREIFSLTSMTPCTCVNDIARTLSIRVNTVYWHLSVLKNAGYVVERSIGRRRAFFVEGQITSEEVMIFFVLNQSKEKRLMSHILTGPGLSQNELSKTAGSSHQSIAMSIDKMIKTNLVTSVAEGSHVRYFPTSLLPVRGKEYYSRSNKLTKFLLKKLEDSGEEPEIVKKGEDRIILELGPKKIRYTLLIGINPYLTSLAEI